MRRERAWVALALLVAGCSAVEGMPMDATTGDGGLDVAADDVGQVDDAAPDEALPDMGSEPDAAPCAEGDPCTDLDASTFGDACNAAGECTGVPCVSSLPCVARAWNGSACIAIPQTGDTCDDGNAGTHTDVCQSNGACAGTACECTSGPCCDGCFLRDAGYICDPMLLVNSECQDMTGCSGGGRVLRRYYREVTCSGTSSACDGPMTNVHTSVPESCSDMGNYSCGGIVPMCRPC